MIAEMVVISHAIKYLLNFINKINKNVDTNNAVF